MSEEELNEEIEEVQDAEPVKEEDWDAKFLALTKGSRSGTEDKEPTDISKYVHLDMVAKLVKSFRDNRNDEKVNAPAKVSMPISQLSVLFTDDFGKIMDVAVMRDIKRELKTHFGEEYQIRVLINKRKNEEYLRPVSITLEDSTHVATKRDTPKSSKKTKK